MGKNKKSKQPTSFSLVIIGIIFITLWLFSTRPWEKGQDNELSFFFNDIYSTILLPLLLIGIYLLGLGLLRLLHASWDKKKKNNTNTNSNIKN